MPTEIDKEKIKRSVWMDAPMPMVTIFKTLDVTGIIKAAKRTGAGFTALMCWCIGRAASGMEEFYILPVGDKLLKYEKLAVNVVVKTKNGIATCDIPFNGNLKKFCRDYGRLTERVIKSGQDYELGGEYMVIGTSALPKHDIDGAANIYAGFYNNPFLIWGRYRKGLFKTTLPVSFQFHHSQFDGEEAAEFLDKLQRVIKGIKTKY